MVNGNNSWWDAVLASCGDPANVPALEAAHDDVEKAMGEAASKMTRILSDRVYGVQNGDPEKPSEAAVGLGDPEKNAVLVKQASLAFGASLAGICVPEASWFKSPEVLDEMGFSPRNLRAVVIAIAMDATAFREAPSTAGNRATRVGYMQMAVVAGCVAELIRGLGFRTVAHGNGCAMSVPLGEVAGLGETGYHGMLITERLGPCVRLCKVFTDMPLAADEPVDLGVKAYCETCLECIEACPPGAFYENPQSEEPFAPAYAVEGKKCTAYWRESGSSCGKCITVCPYTDTALSPVSGTSDQAGQTGR